MWIDCLSEFTIWNVVELSSPVEISSIKSALAGPTSISPTGHIQMISFRNQKVLQKSKYS
jgi:hypothetical protein